MVPLQCAATAQMLKSTNEPGRAESKGAGPKMSFGILVHRGCVQIKLFLRLLHRRKNIGHPLGLDFGSAFDFDISRRALT
jgi:hypothetical protein